MSDEDLKQKLIELIKYYQSIIYNYRQFPDYSNNTCDWDEAERRLEYYTEVYTKLINL